MKGLNVVNELDKPEEFYKLSKEDQEILLAWIKKNIIPRKTPLMEWSSYGLKHLFEKEGFYITNGQFKGAMFEANFSPVDYREKNWRFCISKKSPCF